MSNLRSPSIIGLEFKSSRFNSRDACRGQSHHHGNIHFPEILFREYTESDVKIFCSWITTARALKTVSGDSGECLTPQIFQSWIDCSIRNIVICSKLTGSPLAFCTLSCREIPEIPDLNLEICHLLVKPTKDYFTIGKLICMQAKSDAFLMGYKFLWGRVVPWNNFGKCLAEIQLSEECLNIPSWIPEGFHWYVRNLCDSSLELPLRI
jgi:hypothetical protein